MFKKLFVGCLLCAVCAILFSACYLEGNIEKLRPGKNDRYTVTFDINGGSGTVPAAQTAEANSDVTLPGDGEFSKTGYTFSGWNTNVSGTGTNYNSGASYTPTGNTTLYAGWDDILYTGNTLAAKLEWLKTYAQMVLSDRWPLRPKVLKARCAKLGSLWFESVL